MKILILYFSGTGNTHFVATVIKEALSDELVKISPVETFSPLKIKNFDILIFGFPIYGCKMPEFLKQFADKFTIPKTKKMILFSTFSLSSCNAMKYTANYFTEKGFNVIYAKGIKMPGSDGLLLVKRNSSSVKRLSEKNFKDDKKINNLVKEIREAIYKKDTKPVIQQNVFFDLIAPINKIPHFLERKIADRLYANEKCTHCGICEAVCPTDNIKVTKEKVIFGNECVLCLRCITQCPAEAIQIGNFTKGTVRWKGPDHNFNAYLLLKGNSK